MCVRLTNRSELSCKLCDRQLRLYLCDWKGQFIYRDGWKEGLFVCAWQERDNKQFCCKLLPFCKSCSFCKQVSAKERCKSQLLSLKKNKACERCVLCRALEFCKKCRKCPNYCSRSVSRGQITPVLEKLGSPNNSPKVLTVLRKGYTLPFQFWPNLTRSPHHNKLL